MVPERKSKTSIGVRGDTDAYPRSDNNFDAGSCIDGRMTSAWNWCSQLEKKRFFPVFLLTGFVGFDGQWA